MGGVRCGRSRQEPVARGACCEQTCAPLHKGRSRPLSSEPQTTKFSRAKLLKRPMEKHNGYKNSTEKAEEYADSFIGVRTKMSSSPYIYILDSIIVLTQKKASVVLAPSRGLNALRKESQPMASLLCRPCYFHRPCLEGWTGYSCLASVTEILFVLVKVFGLSTDSSNSLRKD